MPTEHNPSIDWRTRGQRLRLEGEICGCGRYIFPPRDVCPSCKQIVKESHPLSGKGEVYSYTVVRYEYAPEGFKEQAPFVLALVKLEEGPMITAQLTDLVHVDPDTNDGVPFDIHIGDRLEMVTRKIKSGNKEDIITYGYKFRLPVSSSK